MSCSSIFEFVNGSSVIKCVECESSDVERVKSMIFTPNKNFCPKDTKREKKDIRSSLVELLGESEGKCYYECD